MNDKPTNAKGGVSRREFVRMAGTASLAATAGVGLSSRLLGADAGGTDTIRMGLVGCGGRGTGAVCDCVSSSEGVEVVALGDLFEDKARKCLQNLQRKIPAEKMKVTADAVFWGFDAFQKVVDSKCNYVIFATPPHFRPQHLRAAVEAGKHAFVEKPVAVDAVGARHVIETGELARKKGVAIVTGTQKQHQAHYVEVMKRIHDGAIGDIVAAQCWFNTGGLWVIEKKPKMSDMEWQCRNWLYFTWLSGDHIVEQHIHNLDVIYWAVGELPRRVLGMGGRQVRTDPKYGNIFDHFAVEYEYASGIRMSSYCRQTPGCTGRVSERIVGTKGQAYLTGGVGIIEGENPYKYEGRNWNPQVQEHADMIASIRKNEPLNDARRIAESTLMAIAGRMSAYSGRELKWDWLANASKLDLRPPKYEFGPLPVEPVAVPGKTTLV